MDREALAARRNHTHAIVEGALLGDIALVFLMMRVFLPVPVVRNLLWTIACIPFVMLVQRRGLKVAVLAGIASYILFSALVGPTLAFGAINVSLAGILVGIGRRARIWPALNTIWTGVAFAVLDVIVPTAITVVVFRYPVKDLIAAAKNFFKVFFNLVLWALSRLQAPHSVYHEVQQWQSSVVTNWQVGWLAVTILYGLLTMYLVVLVAEMVLRQLPELTLARQKAG